MKTSTLLPGYDDSTWRKQAMMTPQAEDAAIEQALLDQSYNAIVSKAGKLMEAPYRLGFEIVYKNDANSKIVGMYAFRVGKDLLYVPVFFRNSEVKGVDLLYRNSTKLFVPFTKEWVQLLVETSSSDTGRGVDKALSRTTHSPLNLDQIAYPPATHRGALVVKSADAKSPNTIRTATTFEGENYNIISCPGFPDMVVMKTAGDKQAAEEWAAGIEAELRAQLEQTEGGVKLASSYLGKPVGALLADFLAGEDGLQAWTKIAGWMKDPAFMDLWVSTFGDDFSRFSNIGHKKKAAALPKLRVFESLSADMTAEEKQAFCKRGYFIGDSRDGKDLEPVFVEDGVSLRSIAGPGFYDVLDVDGKKLRLFVAPTGGRWAEAGGDHGTLCSSPSDGSKARYLVVALGKDPVAMETMEEKDLAKIYATDKDLDDWKQSKELVDEMASGSTYLLVDSKSGYVANEAIHVHSKDGDELTISRFYVSDQCIYDSRETIHHKKDEHGLEWKYGVLDGRARFVKINAKIGKRDDGPFAVSDRYKVEFDKRVPASRLDLTSLVKEKTASVRIKRALHSENWNVLDANLNVIRGDVTRLGLAVPLTKIAGAAAAEEVLDLLTTKGDLTLRFLVKEGSRVMRLLAEPDFQTSYDNDFGVEVQRDHAQVIGTEDGRMIVPPHRVGDVWGADRPKNRNHSQETSSDGLSPEMLTQMSPEQVQALAQTKVLPQIMESGVMGELVHQWDSAAYIEKVLPELERSLDKVGRILFLVYWKPEDYQQAFGADDAANMESELLSCFKAYGNIILKMSRRARGAREGTASLA